MRGSVSLRVYYLAAFAAGGLYLPFFPRWLEARGMRGIELGVIAAAAPAMGVLAPVAIGTAADALGLRGGLLQVACAGALVSWGSLTLAAAFGAPLGFGTLLVAALAFALFRSPMTLIADVTALEGARSAGTSYGRLRLWGSVGFGGAVLLAGRFVDPTRRETFPVVTTATLVAALLASLRIPSRAELPKRGDRRGALELLAAPDFRTFLAAAFLGQCAHAGYDLCFTLHLLDLGVPTATIGVAWALGTACEVALMALTGPAFRAFPPALLLAFALGSASLRWAALATVRSPTALLALQPLHALSFGLMWLSAVNFTAQRASPRSLGAAQGLLVTAFGSGSVCGMIFWGPAYQRGGGGLVFASTACVAACAAGLATLLACTRGRAAASAWAPPEEHVERADPS
jgi:PPP family 3-phenylpropionic acid transporter